MPSEADKDAARLPFAPDKRECFLHQAGLLGPEVSIPCAPPASINRAAWQPGRGRDRDRDVELPLSANPDTHLVNDARCRVGMHDL